MGEPGPSSLGFGGPGPSTGAHGAHALPLKPGLDAADSSLFFPPSFDAASFFDGDGADLTLPTPPAHLSTSTSGISSLSNAQPPPSANFAFQPAQRAPIAAARKGKGRARSDSPDEDESLYDSDASASPSLSPAPASTAGPARKRARRGKSRGITLGDRIQAAGGLDKVAGRRMKGGKLGTRKYGVVLPLMPELFRSAKKVENGEEPSWEGHEGNAEELKSELERARDPAFPSQLRAALASHRQFFEHQYQLLSEELIKAQIEESVLGNIKRIVVERRDKIRRDQMAKEQQPAAEEEGE
ncbi:hypothetical protein JCM10207_003615 [Rhodosporidiobolus poonsookiae]